MKKNNKGFTMVEIIGAVIIIGILASIIIPGISKLMRSFRESYYEKLEKTINEIGRDFFNDNKIYLPDGLLKSQYVNVNTLITKEYAEELKDYKGKTCDLTDQKSYIIAIYKGNGKYEYQTCISCPNDDYYSDVSGTYCDPTWLTNDNIKYDFGRTDNIYIYYGTKREKVREQLLKTLNVVKVNDNGNELERIMAETKEEGVLPNNIDEVDTTPTLDENYKKEIPLEYTIEEVKEGETTVVHKQELKAIIYKHKAPLVTIKKISDNSNYVSGTWSNGVIITLKANDNYFDLSNTSIGSFQWNVDGKWQNINCDMTSSDSCSISLNQNLAQTYKFRIVTNNGNVSAETNEYRIKVDVDKPKVSISPNGGESIVYAGSTTGNVSFQLTTTDTGGSNIKSRSYAISTSNTTEPTNFEQFYTDNYPYNKSLVGNIYYVWSRVEDNAGNISTEVWPSNPFKMKYEVKYNANGGSGEPSTQYKYHGSALTLSNTTPTRNGYTFKGWSALPNSTTVTYNSGANYNNDASITLYAVWQINRYAVTWKNYDGTTLETDQNVEYGSTPSYNGATPTRTGTEEYKYTFAGWSPTVTSVTGNVTYTATYTSTKNKYTVIWKNYDGTTLETDQNVEYGSTPSYNGVTPTRTDSAEYKYTFAGWSPTVTNVTGNVTYTATYTSTKNKYTVTFDANGGWGITTTITKEYGEVIQLPVPIKTGYSFDSWRAWELNGEKVGEGLGSYTITSDITLVAMWDRDSYTVRFDANGGYVSSTSETRYYNEGIYLPLPTRDGYAFNGWYTNASGGSRVGGANDYYTVTMSRTLYAQWTLVEIPHNCNYSAREYSSHYVTKATLFNWASPQWCNLSTCDATVGHWCSSTVAGSCAPESANNSSVAVYTVTCSICGKTMSSTWCPVHGAGGNALTGGGGSGVQICDAVAKAYSSDATKCIGYLYKELGWTQVTK